MEKLKILLVEDDAQDAMLIERELWRAGFEFTAVRVDSEASFRREMADPPDIILCDYHLPRFDPFQALQLVQASGLGIPLIVVSGSIGEERAVESLRRGASDFLLKDRLGRLGASVSQALEQRRLRQVERTTGRTMLQKEEQYRALADSMPQLVWTKNAAGEFLYFNRQCLDYTGLSEEKLAQGGWDLAVHPEDRADIAYGTQGHQSQVRIRNAQGVYRWHLERQVAQRETVGEIRWVGTCTDVHDQVLTEEALRAERDRLARIASVAPGVIHTYRLNVDGTRGFTYLSPAAFDLFGMTPESILSQQAEPDDLVHADDREELVRTVMVSATQLTPWHFEYRILHPTKGERWLETRSNPLREEDGGTVWHGFLIDITDRKNAEAELRLRDRAIQAVSQGILITRPDLPDDPIVFANPAFEKITGYASSEVLGKNCRFLQGKDTDPETLAIIREANFAGQPCSVELLNYRKDGSTFWNALTTAYIREGAKVLYSVGTLTDVSERRLLQQQYQQAQKMEAFGQLAGGVAHDFNNLLTVINGYTQMALEDLPGQDPMRENLDLILESGHRAAVLTAQLLAFSRQTIVKPQILSLNSVVTSAVQMLDRVIGEDILIQVALSEEPGLVKADPGQLHQVIMNLAVNARDAMPLGGRLTIATENQDDWVHLSVSDTGCGMSEEVMARIFEPFYTTKEVGKGTGLGLATVYGIAESCAGRLEVNSETGSGSTFHLFLPLILSQSVSPEPEKAAAIPMGHETVLVVEDEEPLRKFLCRALEKFGYQVLVAEGPSQALQIAQTHPGSIEVVVTDIVMPGMDGRSLAHQILGDRPEIRILYISGYTDDALLRRGILESRENFLSKPFTIAAICQKVRELLDTHG